MTPSRIAVVGANLAGGRAAEALRAEGFEGAITLHGEEPHRPYERPPLSKEILRGEWSDDKAFLRPPEWYDENEIDLRLGARVETLDDLDADAILLCTGGRPRTLPLPGADGEHVFTLRTLDDAHAIAARAAGGAPVVVIGAGFIGAEVAASLTQTGSPVTLLEVLEVPLERVLGPEIGAIYADIHRANGVDLRTGVQVERIEPEQVVLADGAAFDAAAVVIGVGIEPSVELAERAGIACDNGIVVDDRCRTSKPGVWAAGDVARHPNPFSGVSIRVEHWQNAQNQAAVAAKSILGIDAAHAEVPWFWSDQFDVNLQMAGHATRWDRVVERGDLHARDAVAYFIADDRLVAALGLNRGKDVRGAKAAIEARLTPTDDELRDPEVDLRKLARAASS